MKLGNTEKAIIMIVIGVAIMLLGIIYIAKPNYESAQSIAAENVTLQARLDELNEKQSHREETLAETAEYEAEYDTILNAFPADLNQEIIIMFLEGIHDSNEFNWESVSMGREEQFYTLGSGGADASLTADGSTDVATETSTEASTTEATTEPATTDTAIAEGSAVASTGLQCYRAIFPIAYRGSYESLKNVVNYVDTNSDRMTINSIDIAYDETNDVYTGNMELYCYAVKGEDRPERSVELNEIQTGVDNLFNTGYVEGAADTEGLNAYDENEGSAIETNYDFYAMLNPATSDVSAKVVGQNGSGKDATVISDSSEGVSVLTYDFYENAGKVYCKYTLDNKKSYEAEVTSAEDVKVLLKSSAKKDSDDKVGVRVTINNTTSLPVYVKVSGDDSVSPRVTIAGTSGSVKVYK